MRLAEQDLVGRGDAGQAGALPAIQVVEHLLGEHEAVVQHHGTARGKVRVQQRNAVAIGKRQHDHHPVARTEIHVHDDVAAVGEDVVVGDHDALGLAGGTRGPHDGGQVAAGIDHRRKQRGGGRRGLGRPHQQRDAHFCRQRLQLSRQQEGNHDATGVHARHHPQQRFLALGDGQRHGTQPGPHGAQVGGDEERAVLGKDADAVAGSQPFAPELSRPGVHQGAKLAVADRFLAADDGGRVGLSAGQDPLRRVGDRFVHAKRFPLSLRERAGVRAVKVSPVLPHPSPLPEGEGTAKPRRSHGHGGFR